MECLPEGYLYFSKEAKAWEDGDRQGLRAWFTSEQYAVPDTTAAQPLDPKAAYGIQKPQLHLIPPAANEEMAKALALGAEKYGTFNWRRNRVAMTTYLAAMKRHIDRIIDGEDIDPESGAHHLGHVMAGCAIVLDARRHGMLEDDRVLPKGGGE
jgi:hypothetical protein